MPRTAKNAESRTSAAPPPPPAMSLFERDESAVLIRVDPAKTDRLKGFRDEFDAAQKDYDRGSTANGKAREKIKKLAEESGISKKAISGLRTLQRMDPKEAIAYLNDLTLLAAEYGIFDAAEAAAQAEANEANAASVAAAEKANADALTASAKEEPRREGNAPKGIMAACFYQGLEAYQQGVAIETCPTDLNPEQRAWWREGFLRQVDKERKTNATTSSGKLN